MKTFEIHLANGGLVGYVEAPDDVVAFDKVLRYFGGCNPDNYYVEEIDEKEIEKGYLML